MQEKLLMRFIPDECLSNEDTDRLDRSTFISLLTEFLKSTQSPFTFGLLGSWGAGKSSLLTLLERELKGTYEDAQGTMCAAWTVRFDAWRYENESRSLFTPMLHTLLSSSRTLQSPESDRLANSFFRVAGATLLSLADWGLQAFTSKLSDGNASISIEDIQSHFECIEQEWGMQTATWIDHVEKSRNDVQEYVTAFQKVVSDHIYKDQKVKVDPKNVRLIYLIDDLDRCHPEKVVELIESIKHFCASSNLINLIAVNPDILERSILTKYPALKIDGRRYLEKIVNHSFPVPQPSRLNIQDFCEWQVKARISNTDSLSPKSKVRLNNAVRSFGSTIAELGIANPRKIWRLSNKYVLALQALWAQGEKIGDKPWNVEHLVYMIVLAEDAPNEFQTLNTICISSDNKAQQIPLGAHNVTAIAGEILQAPYIPEAMAQVKAILKGDSFQRLYKLILSVSDLEAHRLPVDFGSEKGT